MERSSCRYHPTQVQLPGRSFPRGRNVSSLRPPLHHHRLHHPPRVAESPVTAPVSDSPATIDDLLLDDPHGEEATAAQSLNKQPFCWEKQWYAVAVASAMDATRPNPIQLLGKNLVVWMDGTGQWQCFEDRCPHRAAPLSEGKIWSDGTLMCSYHGWRFDDQGNCVRIPQAASPEAEQRACSSSRACATKYPIAQAQGMLFVWGEGGKDAEKESSKAPLPVCEHLKAAEERGEEVHYLMRHYVRDLPYDFQTLVENVVDPAHVPFSHHGYQGNRDKVKYGDYELKAVSDSARDRLAVEYEGIMGKSNLSFLPPARVNFFRTPKDNVYSSFVIYCTPTSPGHSRLVVMLTTNAGKQLPWFVRMAAKLPLWVEHVFSRHPILDGDNVFLHYQEHFVAERSRAMESENDKQVKTLWSKNGNRDGGWRKEYFMPTRADALVAAFKNWLDVAGKGGPFGPLHRCPDYSPLVTDHHVLLNRYEQHTKNCPACRSALSWVERLRGLAMAVAMVGVVGAVCSWLQTASLKSVAIGGVVSLVGALAWHWLSLLRAQFCFVDYDHATR